MEELFEIDARVVVPDDDLTPLDFGKKIVELVPEIEETMDWYDHVAFAFLAYPQPMMAMQKIHALISNRQNGRKWRDLVVSPFVKEFIGSNCDAKQEKCQNVEPIENSVQLIIEILHTLQQLKLLKTLEIVYDTVQIACIDPFRLKLFKIIDQLSEEDASKLFHVMNSDEQLGEENYLCLEMHFLRWIVHQKISADDYTKLDESLLVIGKGKEEVKTVPNNPPVTVIKPSVGEYTPAGVSMPLNPELPVFIIKKGLCVIINQMFFYRNPNVPQEISQVSKSDLEPRFGSDLDRDNLAETFRLLSHDVEIYENLNSLELKNTLHKISNYNFSSYDGLTVCILSHGERNSIYTSDSILVELDFIKRYFDGNNCPMLINKPKLFFLQACQGAANQVSVVIDHYEKDSISPTKPAITNFFEAWATVPGFVSYRSVDNGSVFVRRLCDVFQKQGHRYSLTDLMIIVHNNVSNWHTPDRKTQQSQMVSSLTGRVIFQRDEAKFVEAFLNQFENSYFRKILDTTARHMIKTDRATYEKLIRKWAPA